jgi:phosphatidylinositol glycan class V
MHLLSVLVLFSLTQAIFPKPSGSGFALVTSLSYVVSPAGLFFLAPYAENSCARWTFLCCLFFVTSQGSQGHTTLAQDLLFFISGMTIGIATTFRSNGILSGLLLLEEAFPMTFSFKHDLSMSKLRRLIATELGRWVLPMGSY